MQKTNFPSDYNQVMPYLVVNNAPGFMKFMKKVFGAKEKLKHMRDETTIMHAEITIGDVVIMFADTKDPFDQRTGGFFIYVPDADATYDLAISKGASSLMPVSDQPYGRSGGVTDPYGNQWWMTTHTPNP
jgi:PhnB protein